jgi:hypothetical protein
MFGPSASAIPQCGIGDLGSSAAAFLNASTASSWLNAQTNVMPWSKNFCASALFVLMA